MWQVRGFYEQVGERARAGSKASDMRGADFGDVTGGVFRRPSEGVVVCGGPRDERRRQRLEVCPAGEDREGDPD